MAPGPSPPVIWNARTPAADGAASNSARWPASSRTIVVAPESVRIHSIWVADDES